MRIIYLAIVITLSSCTTDPTSKEFSKLQNQEILEIKNVQIVKDFYEYMDTQDAVSLRKIVTKDFAFYFGSAEQPVSFYQLEPMIKNVYTAFPDYKHTIEIIFASGDFVTSKLSYTGTHSNSYQGIEPTGKKLFYKGIFIFKIKDGHIHEMHGMEDDLAMLIKSDHSR